MGLAAEVVARPTTRESGGVRRLESDLTMGTTTHTVWIDLPSAIPPTPSPGDAFLIAALLPAMRTADRLVIDAPVSPALLHNVERAQVFINQWFPEFRPVAIDVTSVDEPGPPEDRAAAMFSGGLDSFYTLHEERDDLSHLVFVHGFDISIDNHQLHASVIARMREVSRHVGIPLAEAATNLGSMSDHYAHWADHYHGWASAVVAHALNGLIGRCYLAAGRTHANHAPMGLQPILPPLWDSERVRFIQHGLAATREDKARVVGEWPVAVAHLRVCWRNPGNAYNCGRCTKCMRTKVNLLVAGALDRCQTLDADIDLETVATLDFDGPTEYELRKETYRVAGEAGLDANLLAALYAPIPAFEMAATQRRASQDLHLLAAHGLTDAAVDENRDLVYRSLSAHQGSWFFRRVAADTPRRLWSALVRRLRGLVSR